MKIVNTDNYGGDYPDEKFVEPIPWLTEEQAEAFASLLNSVTPENSPRFYKVVENDYVLQPGFEP